MSTLTSDSYLIGDISSASYGIVEKDRQKQSANKRTPNKNKQTKKQPSIKGKRPKNKQK